MLRRLQTAISISRILEFEIWARENAGGVVRAMPDQAELDKIRPLWLSGGSLRQIIETCGEESRDICTELYGYQLPWLFHSVAQSFDKLSEGDRVEALAKAALLIELGLPTEVAAKVFLAGVRSRAAALELSRFVTEPTASITRIRNAFLDGTTVEALGPLVSATTLEWLHLLSAEYSENAVTPPNCPRFRVDAPHEVNTLHVRQLDELGPVYLCSTDVRFKVSVRATEELPLGEFVNDPRYVFSRDGDAWIQQCRDPRIQRVPDFFEQSM